MTDIHDIPATLLDADFSDEELVDDAMNAFSPKPVVSRETSLEEGVKEEISLAPVAGTTPSLSAAENAAKKRSWRKPEDKPKRPLSAYNLFFQLERQRLISDSGDDAPYTAEDVANVSRAHKMKKEKRRHRKTHGKISFADLARTIAQKWKTLEPSDKVVFEERAEIEKARYKEDLEEWNIKQQQSFNQRKANMLRKVSLEPNPGMGSHLDKSSGMGMGLSSGMTGSYSNALSGRTSYDLGMYSNHEAALQEEATLQQSLMQRQSLARYQALMEQQLDQASLDQMVLGYSGASSGTSSMSGLSSRRPYLSGGAASSSLGAGSYGGSSYYYEDDYDYNDLAQVYGSSGVNLGRSAGHPAMTGGGSQMHNRIGDDVRDGSDLTQSLRMNTSSARSAPSGDQPYFSSMDRSSSSIHSEHTQHTRPSAQSTYHQQTSLPHSTPAQVEDTLTLDPHQGMSSPVLEADDGPRMDPFNSMHVM